MELNFHQTTLSCLRTTINQTQNQEQTQELRIPDGMPDIGSVLGTWGQVVIRSKEWRSGGMSISGGVMAWVLYRSDEDATIHCLDTWIPFQMKWDAQNSGTDGTMQIFAVLSCIDARLVSARKMMVRSCIRVKGEAFVDDRATLYNAEQLPADIQLLTQTYPVVMPREAGEKAFVLEDDLVLPVSCPRFDRLVRYELRPGQIDQKVMVGKVVFRGTALLHILYIADDGNLASWDFELAFSQFAELGADYDPEATARITMAVTSIELEKTESSFHLKAGMTGQYVIYDRCMAEVVEDAYSPTRTVHPVLSKIDIPVVLDAHTEFIRVEKPMELDIAQLGEIAFYPETPNLMQRDNYMEGELSGFFQIVYYDTQGELQSAIVSWECMVSILSDQDADMTVDLLQTGSPQIVLSGNGAHLYADALMDQMTFSHHGIPAVVGLEIGEEKEKAKDRPSLVLRRVDNDRLWDIAKANNTTVEAIQKANNLETVLDSNQLLLIPIP